MMYSLFRKRILNTYDRQNTIVELEEYVRNLPYVFDCKVKYNQTENDIVSGSVVIPSLYCAIFISGEIKNELAEMVCDYIICPTVATQDSVEVKYENSVFANGEYVVNLIPFEKLPFTVDIIYNVNNEYVNIETAKQSLQDALLSAFIGEVHKDTITEDDIYNVIEATEFTGINVLAVNLRVNNALVDYVSVPASQIAELTDVVFAEG